MFDENQISIMVIFNGINLNENLLNLESTERYKNSHAL